MWNRIETAPKDGTIIDLWTQSLGLADRDSDELRPYTEFRVPDVCWFDGGWHDTDGNQHPYLEGFTEVRFTHWMPVPGRPDVECS